MNVSNGMPNQNPNVGNGMNNQPNQGFQGQQQSMNNAQQPNLTKPNSQMGNMQQDYPQQQNMGYQQNPNMGYQQNTNMGYQQSMGQPMGQMVYQQPVYPMMPAKSTLGLVGLILSILSLICCGPILAIPGLICSIIALIKCRGEKRALVGTIIGVISILLWVVLWFTGIVSLNSLSFTDPSGNDYDIIEEDDDYYYDEDDDYDYEDEDVDNIVVEEDDDDVDIIVEEDDDDIDIIVEEEEDEVVVEEDAEEHEDNDNTGNVGTDVASKFDPSSVVYNGITLTMGEYTAAELEDVLGYTFDEEDMKYVVNPGYYVYTTYWVEKSSWDDEVEKFNRIIYFYFVNNTDEAIPMSDCVLYRLNFYSSDYFDGDTLADWCNLDLGPEITVNSTVDDIIAVLGEPDSDYENEEYGTCSIRYYKMYDYYYKVEFSYKDGKMTEVVIGRY